MSLSSKYLKIFFAAITLCALLCGCTRDPNVRKQKYLESGKRYMNKQQYKEAAIQFMNAARLDPSFAEAHYQLALAELKLGSGQIGYQELMKTVTLAPQDSRAQIDLARLLLLSHMYEQAQQHTAVVLAIDPNNIEALQIDADCNSSLHHNETAIQQMTRAVDLDPSRVDSYMNLGVMQAGSATQAKQAEESFRKAVALAPNSISPHLVLSSYLDDNGRYAEAEAELKAAISIDKKNVAARDLLVKHYLREGKKDEAENAAKEAKAALGSDSKQAGFLARYYLATGNAASAALEMSDLAKQFPKDTDIQHAYLEVLLSQKRDEEAMKQADALLKSNGKDNVALLAKGILLTREGKASEGRDILLRSIKGDPQNSVAHFELGMAYRALGDMGEAKSQWLEATRENPRFLEAQHALAQAALDTNDYRGVKEVATAEKTALPKSADGYLLEAAADMKQTDFKEAETQLRDALKIDPQSSQVHSKLGMLLLATQREPEAEQEFNKALSLNAIDTDALIGQDQIDLRHKREPVALARMQAAANAYPSNPLLHYLYGELLAYQKDLPKAAVELSNTIRLQPTFRDAYFSLAGVQRQLGQLDAAAATYQQAIQQNPRDPFAYIQLGSLFEQSNRNKEAEDQYRKTLAFSPDNPIAANNLAYLLLKSGGNVDEAVSLAEIARRQMPDSAAVADTLGWAYLKKGNGTLAVDALLGAVKTAPTNGTYHYHLGLAYQSTGDLEHAKSEMARAAELTSGEPQSGEVKKALASLTKG